MSSITYFINIVRQAVTILWYRQGKRLKAPIYAENYSTTPKRMASAHKLHEVSFSPQPPSISSSQDFTVYQSDKGTWHLSHSRMFPLPARPHRGGRSCIQNAWDQKCFRVWSFQKIFLVWVGGALVFTETLLVGHS